MFGITAQLSTTRRVSLLLPAFPTPCTSSRMCFSTCPTGLELSREDLEPWGRAKWPGGETWAAQCNTEHAPHTLTTAAATCFWRLTIRSSGNDGSWLLASPMERVMGTLPSNSAHRSVRDVSQSLERGEEKQRVRTATTTAGFNGNSGSR